MSNNGYLTFWSDSEFAISKASTAAENLWDGTMEYSTDTIEWSTWGGEQISSAIDRSRYNLYIRGVGNTRTGKAAYDENNRLVISGENVSCDGNIMVLLDYENVISENASSLVVSSSAFDSLFTGCSAMIKAPELPATTLGESCYSCMFKNCTNLKEAPELPATTLETGCYSSMFYGCSSLETAPVLNATTLKSRCYSTMFAECTSLKNVPMVKCSTAATYCCYRMFYNCRSLVNASFTLSATTLETSCYQQMFAMCSKLVTPPKISAKNFATFCCSEMFSNSGLVIDTYEKPNAIAYTLNYTNESEVKNMFANTKGTFKGTPEAGIAYYCNADVAYVRTLMTPEEVTVYPQTVFSAVFSDDGISLETKATEWNEGIKHLNKFADEISYKVRNITISSSDPNGGTDGDIWIKYSE